MLFVQMKSSTLESRWFGMHHRYIRRAPTINITNCTRCLRGPTIMTPPRQQASELPYTSGKNSSAPTTTTRGDLRDQKYTKNYLPRPNSSQFLVDSSGQDRLDIPLSRSRGYCLGKPLRLLLGLYYLCCIATV